MHSIKRDIPLGFTVAGTVLDFHQIPYSLQHEAPPEQN